MNIDDFRRIATGFRQRQDSRRQTGQIRDLSVAFGKTLKGLYDYEGAWNWAMAMSREERLAKFADVVRANRH